MIQYADFAKLEIRIGTIIIAERIPKADKLLRLVIDFNTEQRQILAGIAKDYKPNKLIGRQVPVLVNLETRVMRGLESQGMILAADVEGRGLLLKPTKKVPNGSVVR